MGYGKINSCHYDSKLMREQREVPRSQRLTAADGSRIWHSRFRYVPAPKSRDPAV